MVCEGLDRFNADFPQALDLGLCDSSHKTQVVVVFGSLLSHTLPTPVTPLPHRFWSDFGVEGSLLLEKSRFQV